MDIQCDVRLNEKEVYNLLQYFDDSSDVLLHYGLEFTEYSKKLSMHARFVLAYNVGELIGFIAYYLNEEGKFVYVPQIVVHRHGRHKGCGHAMIETLVQCYSSNYKSILLEVLLSNANARFFYEREGFEEIEIRKDRILLKKMLS